MNYLNLLSNYYVGRDTNIYIVHALWDTIFRHQCDSMCASAYQCSLIVWHTASVIDFRRYFYTLGKYINKAEELKMSRNNCSRYAVCMLQTHCISKPISGQCISALCLLVFSIVMTCCHLHFDIPYRCR